MRATNDTLLLPTTMTLPCCLPAKALVLAHLLLALILVMPSQRAGPISLLLTMLTRRLTRSLRQASVSAANRSNLARRLR